MYKENVFDSNDSKSKLLSSRVRKGVCRQTKRSAKPIPQKNLDFCFAKNTILKKVHFPKHTFIHAPLNSTLYKIILEKILFVVPL